MYNLLSCIIGSKDIFACRIDIDEFFLYGITWVRVDAVFDDFDTIHISSENWKDLCNAEYQGNLI